MSIIVPAGNKNVEWSPKEETLVKTASVQVGGIQEEVNPLYEAAKIYIDAASDCCKECKKPKGLCECKKDEKPDVNKEDGKVPGVCDGTGPSWADKDTKSDVKSDVKSDSGAVVEVATPEGEKAEGDAKTDIAVAVDKIEEAVVELKDAAQISDAAEEAEIEIEIEDEPTGDVDKVDAGISEIPGKDVSQSEIIVESTPDPLCAEKKVKMDKSASTGEEFCKFAKLTPANRKKLSDYWVNMLGFPKDYVSLMVKDYEK